MPNPENEYYYSTGRPSFFTQAVLERERKQRRLARRRLIIHRWLFAVVVFGVWAGLVALAAHHIPFEWSRLGAILIGATVGILTAVYWALFPDGDKK